MRNLDDSKIIGLFFERSQQAIAELSAKYGKISMRISENILKNKEDAEECVNDSYLSLWNNIPPEKPDPLITYLLKTVRNQSLKKYHSNTAVKRNSYYDTALHELEEILSDRNSPENEFSLKELTQAVNSFLASLNKENRIIFVRRYYYGDSVKDIGVFMDKSPHFISVRLSRIREKLREFLLKEELI